MSLSEPMRSCVCHLCLSFTLKSTFKAHLSITTLSEAKLELTVQLIGLINRHAKHGLSIPTLPAFFAPLWLCSLALSIAALSMLVGSVNRCSEYAGWLCRSLLWVKHSLDLQSRWLAQSIAMRSPTPMPGTDLHLCQGTDLHLLSEVYLTQLTNSMIHEVSEVYLTRLTNPMIHEVSEVYLTQLTNPMVMR